MDKAKWQKVKKGFNINELFKYEDILPCIIREKPTVDGKYLMDDADDGCCGSYGIEYKCEQDGTSMQKEKWKKVDGNLNINELFKYKDILPCVIREKPTVDGKYLIYDADDGCCGSCGIEYKCEQDGTIIAIRW